MEALLCFSQQCQDINAIRSTSILIKALKTSTLAWAASIYIYRGECLREMLEACIHARL